MLPIQWQRHSKRLQKYDYSQAGSYFITINCKGGKKMFGAVENGNTILNDFGEIAQNAWMNTPSLRPNVSLGAFVIMPDHIHGIICIDFQKENNNKARLGKFVSPTQSLGAIIRGYKGTVTKQIKEHVKLFFSRKEELLTSHKLSCPMELIPQQESTWQVNYHEHIIRNKEEYLRITKYIIDNPKRYE